MTIKENIVYLTKYQMRVLYYKCKEGATHEQIAEKLGRDVNTVQYHMTKIYTVLEIKKPGKSKEEMEAELDQEIAPIIRNMFDSIEDVKTWVPAVRDNGQKDDENSGEEMDEPGPEGTPPDYIPPASVQTVLDQAENPRNSPEILAPPPPGIPRRNWRRIAGWAALGSLIAILLGIIFAVVLPIGRQQVSPKDKMVQILIPAGDFKMGSSREDDPQTYDEEVPQHIVYLAEYWIDKMEVSNVQYAMCVAEGACTAPANTYSSTRASYYDNSEYADYPVIFVSWSQAATYCAWAGRRLPTEAEWEKAARGPDGRIYPWGNTFVGTLTNYCDINCPRDWRDKRFNDGYAETSLVGKYPAANVYGVMDMAGNVYEWVADWYAPYSQDKQTNPTGPDSGQERIIRGGAWGDDVAHIRSAVRSHLNGDTWLDFIGFRCAEEH